MESYPPPPYGNYQRPQPPYNATNFLPPTDPQPSTTSCNPNTYSTLQSYAYNSPNYPWNTGSNAQQIYRSQANVSYFNSINQQTSSIVGINSATNQRIPYPQFKSQAERLMYIQGQSLTSARNKATGQSTISAPAGVPCNFIYNTITNANIPT
jgi:hypothetical protein